MMAVHSVLVAGHLCIDITPELTSVPELVPGQLYEIGSAQLTLGGCVANTGLALAAAGTPTSVCSRVGDDPLGEIARRLLAEQGVDLEGITTTAGAATSYSIVLQLPGRDRTFWHHPGANAAFTGREVNLDGVDILHLGYPPLLPELLADDAATAPQSAQGSTQPTDHDLPRPGRGGSAVQSRRGGLASGLRPDHAVRRHRHSEHRRLNVGARHRPNAQRRSGRGMCPPSGRRWMRRRRVVGGCARSVRAQRWR